MDNEQIAFVADALLALCEGSTDRPFYSDARLQQKRLAAERRDPIYAQLIGGRPHDLLLEEECRDVLCQARLTERQSIVLGMRLDGFTFEEIGRRRGHTKQGAMRIFVQALKKIARSFRVYPFRGISEVYRNEVRRGASKGRFGTIAPRTA